MRRIRENENGERENAIGGQAAADDVAKFEFVGTDDTGKAGAQAYMSQLKGRLERAGYTDVKILTDIWPWRDDSLWYINRDIAEFVTPDGFRVRMVGRGIVSFRVYHSGDTEDVYTFDARPDDCERMDGILRELGIIDDATLRVEMERSSCIGRFLNYTCIDLLIDFPEDPTRCISATEADTFWEVFHISDAWDALCDGETLGSVIGDAFDSYNREECPREAVHERGRMNESDDGQRIGIDADAPRIESDGSASGSSDRDVLYGDERWVVYTIGSMGGRRAAICDLFGNSLSGFSMFEHPDDVAEGDCLFIEDRHIWGRHVLLYESLYADNALAMRCSDEPGRCDFEDWLDKECTDGLLRWFCAQRRAEYLPSGLPMRIAILAMDTLCRRDPADDGAWECINEDMDADDCGIEFEGEFDILSPSNIESLEGDSEIYGSTRHLIGEHGHERRWMLGLGDGEYDETIGTDNCDERLRNAYTFEDAFEVWRNYPLAECMRDAIEADADSEQELHITICYMNDLDLHDSEDPSDWEWYDHETVADRYIRYDPDQQEDEDEDEDE